MEYSTADNVLESWNLHDDFQIQVVHDVLVDSGLLQRNVLF